MTDLSLLTGGLAPFGWSPNEETAHRWTISIFTGDGEWNLPQYSGIDVTMTHDGITATIEIPATVPEIGYIRDLVTDLVYYRDKVKMFRLRVLDSEDVLARDGASVRFNCASYEYLLKRRILRVDRVLADLDQNGAWSMITYTQAFEDLGITRGSPPGGTYHQRTFAAGDDIASCIDDWATSDTGFDWWIDADLRWWAGAPRRGFETDQDWQYGTEIAELSRESPIEDYASYIFTTGAQQETRIPTGTGSEFVYPPPNPQIAEAPTKPFGLWEKTVSYPDVVTDASLLEKANWNLQDKGNIRPTYKVVLEPGIWTPAIGLGDIFTLRVNAPPRANIKVPVRIEEIKLGCSSDGGEQVSMSVRAEEPETFLTPSPIGPIPTTVVPPARGRTVQTSRLSGTDDLSMALRQLDARLKNQERPPGSQASGAGYWNSAWGEIARYNGWPAAALGPYSALTQIAVMTIQTRTDRRYRVTFQVRAMDTGSAPSVVIVSLARNGVVLDPFSDAYVYTAQSGAYGGGQTITFEFQGDGASSNYAIRVTPTNASFPVTVHPQAGSSTKFVCDDIGPVSRGVIATELTPVLPADTDWTNVTYQNGFSDYPTDPRPVQYIRERGWVELRGVASCTGVTGATDNKTIFTLPVGFRTPYNNQTFVQNGDNIARIVAVTATGTVILSAGHSITAYVFFDGIRFKVT